MKVLVLTWEFPPFIAGGLGIACYGLMKALLAHDVELDMFLPTAEDVYFPLRGESDADELPVKFFDERRASALKVEGSMELRERLEAIGVSPLPESYVTPGFDFKRSVEGVLSTRVDMSDWELDRVMHYLGGDENLFRKVQEFTSMVIRNAPSLQFDVIHVHDWLTYPAGILLSRLTGKPLVAHIHATEFDRAGGPGDDRIHNIEYAGMTAASSVIAVSQYTAQMIIDRYRINPSKVHIVYNAHTMPNAASKRNRIFKDPLVLFMGRVTIQKGPDYFLSVAKNVIERHPNVRFVLAGSGDMFTKILRGAASMRLKDRFLCTGFLNRRQVERILSATDVFVMPSISEPFGIVPLEAMVFGAVTIVSKQSGVSEILDNAYKVDFWDVDKMSDIIIEILGDSKTRKKVAKAGHEEVLAMRWNEAANSVFNIYRETLCST